MPVDPRLLDLVVRWEELRQDGLAVSPEELCRDQPELLDALRQQLQVLRAVNAALSVKGAGETTPGSRVATARSSALSAGTPCSGAPAPGVEVPDEAPGYQLLKELGRGGMGVVYLARQRSPDRLVALKMILAGTHAGAGERLRFRTEVQSVAGLSHPNIVQIYEVGEHRRCLYCAMEFIDGGSLAEVIRGRPQPPAAAARVLQTLARTMEAVHQRGIVHRDLKPANVLLSSTGLLKVADFGLAKQGVGEGSPSRHPSAGAGLTLTHQILGTPGYMAPEQAAGRSKQVGPTTDVYALGAILYEMLTGRPPFGAETPWATIQQVLREEPIPPRTLQELVPRDLETICLKCLHKDPARRYASAGALADDLGRFLAGEPVLARPVGPGERAVKWARRRPTAAALLAVSVLAVLTLAILGLWYQVHLRQALKAVSAHAGESRQRLVQLHVAEGGHALDAGDWGTALIWFTEALRLEQDNPSRQAMHRLRIGAVLGQCPRPIHLWFHDGPVWHAEFSPDGQCVLTVSEDHTARLWHTRTGEALTRPLHHPQAVWHGAFSPDGRSVVTACADGTARLWDAATGAPRLPPLRHNRPVVWASFNVNGNLLVTASEDHTARLWEVRTGKPLTAPLRHDGAVRYAEFSPNGRLVATASDDRTARIWEATTGKAVTPPLKHKGAVNHAVFHPNGTRLVTASADHTVRMWDVDGGRLLSSFRRHRAGVGQASFAQQGRWLITASDDGTAGVWDASSGERLCPPLRHGSGVHSAALDAAGRRMVTASDDNSARVQDVTTGEPLTPLLRHSGSVNVAWFSQDGRSILTASNDGTARLWDVKPRGCPVVVVGEQLPKGPGQPPRRWSGPGGLVVLANQRGNGVEVRDAEGELIGPPLGHGSTILDAAFSAEGDRLVTGGDDNTARIWDVTTGKLMAPPLKHQGSVRAVAFSRDGRLVVAASDGQARVWDSGTGEPVTPSLPFTAAAHGVFFSADGSRVGVRGADRKVWTWGLQADERPVADLVRLAQLLGGSRIDTQSGLFPLEPDLLRTVWQQMRPQPGSR
jgi:WD40 repeat protein